MNFPKNWHMMEQGTEEWAQIRCKKSTTSRLEDVLAKGAKGGESKTRRKYLFEKVAERLSGVPTAQPFENQAMRDGVEREPVGRGLYEERLGVLVQKIGFIDHPTIPFFGSSPDGIVLESVIRAGIEIKCPELQTYLGRVDGDEIPRGYYLQCQGLMECAGLEYVDFVNYHPALPDGQELLVQRIYRNQAEIINLCDAVRLFNEEVEEVLYRVQRAIFLQLEAAS